MKSLSLKNMPTIFQSTKDMSLAVSREVKAGRLRKIGKSLYTTNLNDDMTQVVRQNWLTIVSLLYPGRLLSNRTAYTSGVSSAGIVYVEGGYRRSITLHGTTFTQFKGAGVIEGDMPMMDIYMPSVARMLLMNLTPSRVREDESKNVSREEIETRLMSILNAEGEAGLNRLRDRVMAIAAYVQLEREAGILNEIIGAILGTRNSDLDSPTARAYSAGSPYDQDAVQRIERLWQSLNVTPPKLHQSSAPEGHAFYVCAFFDAYFSNYIEGTHFEVGEAKQIIDSGILPVNRPADAHDILGTYRVVGSIENMRRTPGSVEELLNLLKERHSNIMGGRPEKRPGEFKESVNFAGSTRFVSPKMVNGTIAQGFEFYRSLTSPVAKALLLMFLVAEVHPFDDGNGRLARVMMNAELVSAKQSRMIIPSVFRNEYISSLKRLTNHSQPESFIRVMTFAHEFVSRISFESYDDARDQLQRANAFEDPADEKKLLLPLERS